MKLILDTTPTLALALYMSKDGVNFELMAEAESYNDTRAFREVMQAPGDYCRIAVIENDSGSLSLVEYFVPAPSVLN